MTVQQFLIIVMVFILMWLALWYIETPAFWYKRGNIFTPMGRAKMRYNKKIDALTIQYMNKGISYKYALELSRDELGKLDD